LLLQNSPCPVPRSALDSLIIVCKYSLTLVQQFASLALVQSTNLAFYLDICLIIF